MNPFDTLDTTSPTASPTPSSAPATINIDTMLADLGQQTTSSGANPVTTMQLSSLDEPIPSHPASLLPETRSLWLPSRLRKLLSLVATIILVIIGYRFISVQYPLETKSFINSIVTSFHSIIAIIQKNQNNSFMTGSSLALTGTDILSGGEEDFVETPLSDAIAEAASGNSTSSSSEQVRDIALSGTTVVTGVQYFSGSESGSAITAATMEQTITHAVASSDAEHRDTINKKLFAMKDVLSQKLIDLTLSNNTFHLSLVKVALKNIDLTLALSDQAHDSVTWGEVDMKVQSIQDIYDRLEKL